MKGLRDGPVKTYLFREYPNTLEEAISLAMQEEFSRRQAKLHAKTGGPEPMDLSSATTAGQQQRRYGKVRCYKCSNIGHYARECMAGGRSKKRQGPVGAGRPTGDAVSRVELGHATLRTVAPSEKVSRCDMQDDKPNLVILNVMSKRVNSLRALVDSGASNNFVRQESLRSLDFEEADTPRGVLEVRLATGATVRTEKRVVRVRFSYKRRTFVEDLIVLDLDDKFDLVLGMPWLARHDPVINWEKRTLVRFNNIRATESDGPVSATHAPDGACGVPVEAAAAAAASDHRQATINDSGSR
ncbi:Retrotransposon-derived protein PEG10 [Phytophthora citrophthora]|uniref:Retrotransposon-derived protein PEG10 n=1 Tax=Phytophthora citrophthora TaxID=4793 RepID=A0AAD9GS62_9STRA|nr:Retrotransposon-derived protein PEG10 [Phytophthora citrophthora]